MALFYLGVSLLQLHWSCYFDDFFLVAAAEESEHIHFIQSGFFSLLGWATSSEKDSFFNCLARVLGVCVSFSEIRLGFVVVLNTEHRKRDLCRLLDTLIARGSATSQELTVLRGRLLFADNQIFGRRARQIFTILSKACARRKNSAVSGELLHALLFFRDRVVDGGPRRVSACSREKLTIFTDASFEKEGAGLGGILYNSKAQPLKWFAEWIDPCDLVPFGSEIKDGLIFELEVFASALCSLCAKSQLMKQETFRGVSFGATYSASTVVLCKAKKSCAVQLNQLKLNDSSAVCILRTAASSFACLHWR